MPFGYIVLTMKDDIISIAITAVVGFFYLIWKAISGIFRFIGKLISDVVSHAYKLVVRYLGWVLFLALASAVAYFLSNR